MTKIKSHSTLPEGYKIDYSIDLLKNRKKLIMINFLGLALAIPVVLAYILVIVFTTKTLDLSEMEISTVQMLVFIIVLIAYIFLHELTHAIFFKLATKSKVKFGFHGIMASASVPGIYFYKKPYLIAGLAPAVIFTVIFVIFMFFLDNIDLLLLFIVFASHFTGCVGDFYIAYKLKKYPDDTLIEDTGTGMKFYIKSA